MGSEDPPVARNLAYEQQICAAIKARAVVQLKYDDTKPPRWFAPHALHKTATGKICVSGPQLATVNASPEKSQSRDFEVGRIQSLVATGATFRPYPLFSSFGDYFKHGVLCAVDRP